jgi:hypothetical protein
MIWNCRLTNEVNQIRSGKLNSQIMYNPHLALEHWYEHQLGRNVSYLQWLALCITDLEVASTLHNDIIHVRSFDIAEISWKSNEVWTVALMILLHAAVATVVNFPVK